VRVASVAVALCLVASSASAQRSPNGGTSDPGSSGGGASGASALDPAEPLASLVLRPAAGMQPLVARTARMLEWRRDVAVGVGEPPPPELLEAVPVGHVAMAREGGRLRIVLGGREGVTFATDLAEVSNDEDGARALSLAIEALWESAIRAPREAAREARSGSSWVYVETEDYRRELEERARRAVEPIAKPTVYLRLLIGYSFLRQAFLIGPGAGFGLCVRDNCAVIEGELPVLGEERLTNDDVLVRYRAVNLSARLQLRPFDWGIVQPGVSIGFLTRIGNASVGGDQSYLVTDLGVRGSAELGLRIADELEVVAEGGVDFAITRARLAFATDGLYLVDPITPWVVASLRMRP
jgi:hypothetical protein